MVFFSRPRVTATPAFTNRQVADFYFRPCRDEYDEVILEYYRCRCGSVRKRVADADDDDLADSLPAPAAKRRLRGLLGELKDVESISKALQGDHVTLLDARVWFDSLIAARASYARYLAPRAAIVQSPHFEAACVRVLKDQTERLTSAEKTSLAPFLAPSPSDDASDDEEQEETSSFVERIQKRRRLEERHAVPLCDVRELP
ncbi:hypothetical protein PRNP1_007335 [Phytophthora ramorum]